jgi:hypothetical protein
MIIDIPNDSNNEVVIWTVWLPCWKALPESLHYYIINLIDSIDIRRYFNLLPRKLQITKPCRDLLSDHIALKATGYIAKYNRTTNTLHTMAYYVIHNDILIDNIYSHKIYKNIHFDTTAYNNIYFTNIDKSHTESHYKCYLYSKITIFIEKQLKTNVVISNTPIQNITM